MRDTLDQPLWQAWSVGAHYARVRERTRLLAEPLSDADATPQSMPDASPAKWHLAHTSWFFEAMVLVPHLPGYRPFNPDFGRLFNSYYETMGERHPRPQRGLLTRPSLEEVLAYRAHVDRAMAELCAQGGGEAAATIIELGCHHEEQHQELLLTDILNLFAANPLRPAYRPDAAPDTPSSDPGAMHFQAFVGGNVDVGHDPADGCFGFDCEGPRHRVWLEDYKLGDRLVTNGEWLSFIEQDGYRDPLLWLSQGWAMVQERGWQAPLYWEQGPDGWQTMTLGGMRRLDPHAPVTHVSLFEADAFARWAGKRLPTEFEWEHAAAAMPLVGNFADSGPLAPRALQGPAAPVRQMFGDVWEWTGSAFAPYPRFRPEPGAAGEYNGKFMSGQFVLRGGSCVTPPGHIRPTYRNFFPPDTRWQFSGVRLAEDF